MQKENIEKTVGDALATLGYELVDLIIQAHGSKKLLQFFVDKRPSLTLGDCEDLTNKIDSILSMENIIDGAYILEVSSPGVRRALKKPEHFKRFIGQRAKIQLKELLENRGVFTGLIDSANDTEMTLSDSMNKFVFKYENIKKANLDPILEF